MQYRYFFILGLALVVFAPLLGCGPGNSLNRQPVSGKVTLNNTPIEQGTIEFCPQQERGTTSSGTVIAGGAYAIKKDKGLPPGTYTVKIFASRRDSATVDDMPGPMSPPATQLIPARYNIRSELVAEVTSDSPNAFDFELRSR